MNRFLRSSSGAVFVEFTAVFPIILLLTMGALDFSFLMIKWVSASKATYAGARLASIMDPVASGINAATGGTSGSTAGASCFNQGTGESSGKCTAKAATVCTGGTSGGSCCPVGTKPGQCTANYAWNESTFKAIYDEMDKFLLAGSLDRRQLQITYEPTDFGFAMRPVGAPMNITVSLRCQTYPFFMLYPLMGWALPGQPSDCAGIPGSGVRLPAFPTTVGSEDLSTVN